MKFFMEKLLGCLFVFLFFLSNFNKLYADFVVVPDTPEYYMGYSSIILLVAVIAIGAIILIYRSDKKDKKQDTGEENKNV